MKKAIALSLLLVSSVGFAMEEEEYVIPTGVEQKKGVEHAPAMRELGADLLRRRQQQAPPTEMPPPPPPLEIAPVVQKIQVADLMKLYSQWYNYVQRQGVDVTTLTKPEGGPFGDLIDWAGKGFTAIINRLYSQQNLTLQVAEKFAPEIYRLSTLIEIAPVYGASISFGDSREANPEKYPNLPFAGALGAEFVMRYIWSEMARFTSELIEELGLYVSTREIVSGMGLREERTKVYTIEEKEIEEKGEEDR